MNIEIVADEIAKKRLGSLLRILSILVLKLRGGKILDLKPIVEANKGDARKFLENLGSNLDYFDDLIEVVYKKPETVRPHAVDFVKNFRAAMNLHDFNNNNEDITKNQRTILGPLLTLVTTPDATSSYGTLQRNIQVVNEPEIAKRYNAHFTETTEDTANLSQQIKTAIKNLTGRSDSLSLTTEERAKFAKTEPLKYIDKLRATLRARVAQEVISIVNATGEEHAPVSLVMEQLAERKIASHPYPPEFKKSKYIHVNNEGKLCDMEGRLLKKGNVTPGAKIELNNDYQPERVSKGKAWLFKEKAPGAKDFQYISTLEKRIAGRQKKFNRINEIITNGEIEGLKAKWRSKMDLKDINSQEGMFPFLTEFLFNTSSRVGSGEGMTAGERTYGASNFLVKHVVSATPSKVVISYPIKGGKKEHFEFTTEGLEGKDAIAVKKLITFLKDKTKGKTKEDFVWSDSKGKRLSPTKYNAYLKGLGNMTAHNFRTLRGTELAAELLPEAAKRVEQLKAQAKAKGKKLSATEVHKLFNETITNVGKALGHIRRTSEGEQQDTASTAIQNYIDPQLMVDWFNEVGIVIPTNVAAAAKESGIEV